MDADRGMQQLSAALRPFRRYLLRHALRERALFSLWPFLLTATLIGAIARVWPLSADRWLIVAALPAWFLWQIGAALLQPRSELRDAQTIDRRLNLRERVATALLTPAESAGEPLARLQLADAVAALARHRPGDLQLKLSWRRAWPVIPLAACAAAALVLPNPLHDRLRSTAEAAERRAAAAAVLRAYLADAGQADDASDGGLDELQKTIAGLAERLGSEEAGLSQALAELNTTQQQLSAELLPDREQRRLQLAELSRRLADLAQQPPEPPSIRRSAAERLEQTAERLSTMDNPQRSAAADRFRQLATEAAATEPELAAALASAAGDLQNGAVDAAADALGRAAARVRDAEERLERQVQRESAVAALQQARQALQASPTTGGPGGADGSAAAAPEPLSAPLQAAQQAAPTTPLGMSNSSANATPASDGLITLPTTEAAQLPVAVDVPTGAAVGEQRAPAAVDLRPADAGPLTVPAYTQRAREAIERGQIPSHLRELVRNYFDALAQPEAVAP